MAETAFKGTPVHTVGDLPTVGQQAPDFTITGADLGDIALHDLAGKRVVLNIFPSIDTGVCATSVRRFNELAASLDNTSVVCVSADLPFALGRFCGAEGIDNVATGSPQPFGMSPTALETVAPAWLGQTAPRAHYYPFRRHARR